MLVRNADPVNTTPVEMEGVKDVTMQIMVGRDDGAPTFAMRHFVVQPGGNTPLHQHDYEHEVYIIEGDAQVECDGRKQAVSAGDVLYIEANTLHQFCNKAEVPLRFLCLVPVTFDCGKPVPGS